jgi:hypothetical protein
MHSNANIILDKFAILFSSILTNTETIRYFLLTTKLRRIDIKVFKILSQNILNKIKLNFSNNILANWNSFLLLLTLYSVDKGIIDCEEGDIIIYSFLDRYMFDKESYYEAQEDWVEICNMSNEIEYNFLQFIMATLCENKYDYAFVNSFLDDLDSEFREKILGFVYKNERVRQGFDEYIANIENEK